jgi:hypothetical protein
MSKAWVIDQLSIFPFLIIPAPALGATATLTPANTAEPTAQLMYFLIGGLVFLTIVLVIVVIFLLKKFRRY